MSQGNFQEICKIDQGRDLPSMVVLYDAVFPLSQKSLRAEDIDGPPPVGDWLNIDLDSPPGL